MRQGGDGFAGLQLSELCNRALRIVFEFRKDRSERPVCHRIRSCLRLVEHAALIGVSLCNLPGIALLDFGLRFFHGEHIAAVVAALLWCRWLRQRLLVGFAVDLCFGVELGGVLGAGLLVENVLLAGGSQSQLTLCDGDPHPVNLQGQVRPALTARSLALCLQTRQIGARLCEFGRRAGLGG